MNHVCLSGRMTKDPVLKTDRNGLPVVNFILAVNRNKEKTDFVPIVAWRTLAESICDCGFKGMSMSVSGHLRQDEYDKNGIHVSTLSVEAYSIDFHSRKPKDDQAPMLEDDAVPFTCTV